eukprot:COSAG04_NODE_123_length_24709_cov_113.457294_12_plen_98_part_00
MLLEHIHRMIEDTCHRLGCLVAAGLQRNQQRLRRTAARRIVDDELDQRSLRVVRVKSVLQQIRTDARTRGPFAKSRHAHSLQVVHQLRQRRVGRWLG